MNDLPPTHEALSPSDPFPASPQGNLSLNLSLHTGENVTEPCSNHYCVSDEEYLDMIYQFIYPTPFEWGLIVLYIIVFVVGLVGNFLVCLVVWSDRRMRTITNLFIVNLSVADFLVILVCLPTTVIGDVTETWYLGSVMCKIVLYLQVKRD